MSFPFRLPLFLDGAAACKEITGEISDDVCSEKIIINNPQLLIDFKKKALSNGANAILAPTSGITHQKLSDMGLDDSFSEINQKIMSISVNIEKNKVPVGGCIVPSTLFVSPYGKDSFEEVYLVYLEKITILKDCGADFILLDGHDSLCDMRAGILAAKSVNIPVFVIMNVDENGKSAAGNDFIASLITLQAMGVASFGIYCTDGIEAQTKLIQQASAHNNIPLIASVDTSKCSKEQLVSIAESGASVFIDKSCWKKQNLLKALLELNISFDKNAEKDTYAAAVDCEAFFLPDILDLSSPVYCGYDMTEQIIDLDNEVINAVHIFLNSTDDAALLAENATMSRLPFLVHADSPVTLEAALRYYQGRLIVDTCCDIDENEMKCLAERYGAILY